MKARHTQGPWESHGATVYAGEVMIASCHAELFRELHPVVCYRGTLKKEIEIPESHEQANANARLAASAPELLCLLERFADEYLMRDPSAGHVSLLTLEQVRAIILKARGES